MIKLHRSGASDGGKRYRAVKEKQQTASVVFAVDVFTAFGQVLFQVPQIVRFC
jgi:hypothetical protein